MRISSGLAHLKGGRRQGLVPVGLGVTIWLANGRYLSLRMLRQGGAYFSGALVTYGARY